MEYWYSCWTFQTVCQNRVYYHANNSLKSRSQQTLRTPVTQNFLTLKQTNYFPEIAKAGFQLSCHSSLRLGYPSTTQWVYIYHSATYISVYSCRNQYCCSAILKHCSVYFQFTIVCLKSHNGYIYIYIYHSTTYISVYSCRDQYCCSKILKCRAVFIFSVRCVCCCV